MSEPIPPVWERRKPTLYQQRNGYWYARFRHRELGVRTVALGVQTPTAKDGSPTPAEEAPRDVRTRFERAFSAPYLAGTYSPWEAEVADAPALLLSDAIAEFLARYEPGKTRDNYASVLNLFAGRVGGYLRMAEIDPGAVQGFIMQPHLSAASQASYHRQLRAFFNHCVREEWCRANPVDGVRRPRSGRTRRPFVWPDAFERLFAKIEEVYHETGPLPGHNDEDRRIIWARDSYRALLALGLRDRELAFAQVQDVGRGYLDVRIKTKDKDGFDFRPKGREARRIPLNRLGQRAVEAALARTDGQGRSLLFPAARSQNPMSDGQLRRTLYDYRDTVGLTGFRVHDFRGHFITYHLLLGYSPFWVAEVAGHKDISTTMGYVRQAQTLMSHRSMHDFRAKADALGFDSPHQAPQKPKRKFIVSRNSRLRKSGAGGGKKADSGD